MSGFITSVRDASLAWVKINIFLESQAWKQLEVTDSLSKEKPLAYHTMVAVFDKQNVNPESSQVKYFKIFCYLFEILLDSDAGLLYFWRNDGAWKSD